MDKQKKSELKWKYAENLEEETLKAKKGWKCTWVIELRVSFLIGVKEFKVLRYFVKAIGHVHLPECVVELFYYVQQSHGDDCIARELNANGDWVTVSRSEVSFAVLIV